MALDVNGYNSVFKSFVDFAQERIDANQAKAVADASVKQLGNRRVLAITYSKTDEVHKWLRTNDEYFVNDHTRKIFKQAIANMFGGEDRIPDSVKTAMLMDDYNCGKPLTARRIMAVKVAIDADGTAKALSQAEAQRRIDKKFGKFESEATKATALGDGFTRAELKNLAKAVNFLRAANPGMTEAEAYREVSTPYTKANRLFQYGGNFLKNADNFARGLQLLDDFAAWHSDLVSFFKNNSRGLTTNFANADTPTKLNANTYFADKPNDVEGLETFVFRDLANDPSADLSKAGEELFGVENNATMRMCALVHDSQASGSLISIPPEKRRVLYAAFDALVGISKNAEEANAHEKAGIRDKRIRDNLIFIARVIKNLPALEAKMAKGPLTAKDVIKICYPDLKKPVRYDFKAINDFTMGFEDVIEEKCGEFSVSAVTNIMAMTGCTLKEAISSFMTSKPLPILPHLAGYSFDYSEHRDGGAEQMQADLTRGYNYGVTDANGNKVEGKLLLAEADYQNTLTFPGGEKINASAKPEHRAGVELAVEKVKALCGKGHTIQANAVGYCLTQSANAPLNRALGNYGIFASEHVVLDYTLSKDEETGAVTITYASPKNLPIKFSWTTTVAVDGSCTSTPMVVEPPVKRLDAAGAQAMVADACERRGVQLDQKRAARAADIMQRFCTDMPLKNAKMFANFVITLKLTAAEKRNEDDIAADMAESIRDWSEFGFGKTELASLETFIKDNFTELMGDGIADATAPNPRSFADKEKEVSTGLFADGNRGVFTINGEVFNNAPAVDVVTAFKKAVPNTAMRQGLSYVFNQTLPNTFMTLSNRIPLAETNRHPNGIDTVDAEGIELIVSRNTGNRKYKVMTHSETKPPLNYGLQVSEDGRSATVTVSVTNILASGAGPNPLASYGEATYSMTLKLDLSGEKPVATDVKLAQEFSF